MAVNDEMVGFRYFDTKDMLGFVDRSANLTGGATVVRGREDDGEDVRRQGCIIDRILDFSRPLTGSMVEFLCATRYSVGGLAEDRFMGV